MDKQKTFFRVVLGGSYANQDFSDLSEARAKIVDIGKPRKDTKYDPYWTEIAAGAKLFEVNETWTDITNLV
jgi:hypothetical protein